MNISDNTGPFNSGVFSTLDLSSNSSVQNFIINYGYLEVNQFDGDLYGNTTFYHASEIYACTKP